MVFDIYNPYDNQVVTTHYVGIIEQGIVKAGHRVKVTRSISRNKGNKSRGIVVISPLDVIKARLAGYRYVLFWSQGLVAEESYMRNGSRARLELLKAVSKSALKRADLTFLVSDAMRDYYQEEYGVTLVKTVVMPCFNEEVGGTLPLDERDGNVFLYAGGLAPWQCFEATVNLYRAVEEQVEDASLLVLVKDRERAERILKAAGVAHYEIDYVGQEQLQRRIQGVSYGFCLREDNPVNNVATPTKLSTYVANDIVPICSQALVDFCSVSASSRAVIQVSSVPVSSDDRDRIVAYCKSPLSREEIRNDFFACFGRYYSTATYVDEIAGQVKELA